MRGPPSQSRPHQAMRTRGCRRRIPGASRREEAATQPARAQSRPSPRCRAAWPRPRTRQLGASPAACLKRQAGKAPQLRAHTLVAMECNQFLNFNRAIRSRARPGGVRFRRPSGQIRSGGDYSARCWPFRGRHHRHDQGNDERKRQELYSSKGARRAVHVDSFRPRAAEGESTTHPDTREILKLYFIKHKLDKYKSSTYYCQGRAC